MARIGRRAMVSSEHDLRHLHAGLRGPHYQTCYSIVTVDKALWCQATKPSETMVITCHQGALG